MVHLKPDQRASWAYHGEEGWYVGPSMEHYCCVKCYLPSTTRERDVDSLQFFPTSIPFPNISTEEYLKQAASDIVAILQKPPSSIPYLAYGDTTQNALVQIATFLGRATTPPTAPQVPISDPGPVQDPPRAPLPVHPPRVPTLLPVHPPRVPTLPVHPPRVQLPIHLPEVQPLSITSPAMPISPVAYKKLPAPSHAHSPPTSH